MLILGRRLDGGGGPGTLVHVEAREGLGSLRGALVTASFATDDHSAVLRCQQVVDHFAVSLVGRGRIAKKLSDVARGAL